VFRERMQEWGKWGLRETAETEGRREFFVSDLGGGKIIIFLLYFGPYICILLFFDPITLGDFLVF
jgi:hypothetical protein